jgi:hypothetical protein
MGGKAEAKQLTVGTHAINCTNDRMCDAVVVRAFISLMQSQQRFDLRKAVFVHLLSQCSCAHYNNSHEHEQHCTAGTDTLMCMFGQLQIVCLQAR